MLVYVPAFLLIFLQIFYAEHFKNKYKETNDKKNIIWVSLLAVGIFLILFSVSGFRYGIGIDYFYGDNTIFNQIKEGYSSVYKEPLLNLLIKGLINSNLENPNIWFFLFFAFFTNMAFVIAIFLNKDNDLILPTFVLMFYMMFFTGMNQMRQTFGLSFGLLAFALIYNYKHWWLNILAFVIALIPIGFHYSTILNVVPLIVYLILRKWNKTFTYKGLLITTFVIIAIAPVAFITLKYTLKYIPFVNKYAYFFDPNFDTSAPPFVKFLAAGAMFVVPMINYIYVLKYFKNSEDYNIKMILVFSGINIFLMVFGVMMNSIIFADRLKTLFYMLELFFIPYLFRHMEKGTPRMVYMILLGSLMVIWTVSTLPTSLLYPYRSIFFPDIAIY